MKEKLISKRVTQSLLNKTSSLIFLTAELRNMDAETTDMMVELREDSDGKKIVIRKLDTEHKQKQDRARKSK